MISGHTTPPADDPLGPFLRSLDQVLAHAPDARRIDQRGAVPRETLLALADLGTFGVSLPAAYGGSELGLAGACAVVEHLARCDRAVATTVGLHLGLGTRGLVAFGSDAQRERHLPDLAAGRVLAAFATTEPGAGSDLSRLGTIGTVGADGLLHVRGQKAYVTNGGLAGLYTIAIGTPGLGGAAAQSLVLVERGDDGLAVGREEDKLGLCGSSTTPVYLDVRLPLERLLGEPGAGARMLSSILAWGRTAMAAGCVGTARAALDRAVDHVRVRHQFGRPLAAQPVVRQQIAGMAADLHAARALVAWTAAATSDGAELERRSLAAKVFASEADWAICDLALQLHGGAGYIEESGLPLLLRDARVTRIFEGANDVLLGRLGVLELTQPRAAPAAASSDARLVERVAAERRRLCSRDGVERPLAALRDARGVHHLGGLVVLRTVAEALAAAPGTRAATAPLTAHARDRLARRAEALCLDAPRVDPSADAIVHHLLDGADA